LLRLLLTSFLRVVGNVIQGLREEITSLQHRVKELETGNCALSALLVQRLGQKINYSPTTVAENRSVMFDIHRSPPSVVSRPARPVQSNATSVNPSFEKPLKLFRE